MKENKNDHPAFYQRFTLGVLGGGQLGRMLIQKAIDFNLDVAILDPDENAPCRHLAKTFVQGALQDYDTVYNFGKSCDLLTIEIENVNTDALKKLQTEGIKVFPEPEVIQLIQDKRKQKQFYKETGIPTAAFVLTNSRADVYRHENMLPAVHKLGKEGYDGRGVQIIKNINDLDKAFDAPGVLENLVPFEKEIAVIVARNSRGEISAFPAVELSYHPEKNLVEFLFSPARLEKAVAIDAEKLAKKVIEALGMTGLLAVEMFVLKNGDLLVNEVAPRTHNSGHQSIEGNVTSQFEQHLRAILNLPLGDTAIVIPSAMVNLLGEDGFTGDAIYEGMESCMRIPGVHVHLYGKKITKPFRKMGHVTIVDHDEKSLREKVATVKSTLKIKA